MKFVFHVSPEFKICFICVKLERWKSMTSEQATAVSTALTTTGQSVLTDFISVLPAIGTIIGIAFVIGFVVYWLKKLRKVR